MHAALVGAGWLLGTGSAPAISQGLSGLWSSDAGVRLEMAHQIPPWAWALLVVGAAFLSVVTYRRLQGARPWRFVLASLRTLTIILLLVLLAGPRLVRPNLSTEPDWLVVLIDRSSSMTIPDAPATAPGGPRITRDEQARAILDATYPTLDALARDRRILWLGFDSTAYELPLAAGDGAAPAGRPVLEEPTGRRTALGASIADTLSLVAARPVAGVVVLSDGRSIDTISDALRERLKRVDVYPVPLGSPEPLPDLAVSRAEAPRAAFINDTVPVTIDLERLGEADPPGATVRVVDRGTGLTLAEQRVEPSDLSGDGPRRMTLSVRPTTAGEATWLVSILPDTPDLISRNNTESLDIELVDRPLRVLYFDGYPRWEQRYIKNLLLREPSVRGTAMILSPDRRYTQDGDDPLTVLPRTPDDWKAFDVVILGDFRADLLSAEQAEALKINVAIRGGGVLWVGGPGATPGSWASSPLSALLPFTVTADRGGAELPIAAEPVTIWRTALGERLGVLELGDPDPRTGLSPWPMQVSDPRTGWSLLRWSQVLLAGRLKATAEVLAVGVPESAWPVRAGEALEAPTTSTLDAAAPLVVSMRYGAGRIIYVATDEIWRWRYGRGEALTERFWIPFIRALGRERLARTGQSALLEITPRQARVDQPVRLTVRLLDQALVDRRADFVALRIRRQGPTGDSEAAGVVRLAPEPATGTLTGGGGAPTSYAATWLATEPGRYIVEADDALLSDLRSEIVISHPDDELRRLETDHALLASLAEPNAGHVLDPADLSGLGALPSRARTVEGQPDVETLWDKPAALAMLLALLVLEWVGRRLIKLS